MCSLLLKELFKILILHTDLMYCALRVLKEVKKTFSAPPTVRLQVW